MPTSIAVEEFVQRLDGVRKTANGYSALCPGHDDERSSLSVTSGENGRLVLHCHAGCDHRDIRAAVGYGVDGASGGGRLIQAIQSSPSAPKREVATYPYVDEDGAPLYEVVRYVPKDFRVRRRGVDGNVSWGYSDAKRVWYRLPSILHARKEARPILVAEGEKDCDALSALGFTATTIAGGANGRLPQETPSLFAGTDVVILPDNDTAGQQFAERLASLLLDRAGSVRILNLPDLPPKGDVSDWIGAGGTKEELSLKWLRFSVQPNAGG